MRRRSVWASRSAGSTATICRSSCGCRGAGRSGSRSVASPSGSRGGWANDLGQGPEQQSYGSLGEMQRRGDRLGRRRREAGTATTGRATPFGESYSQLCCTKCFTVQSHPRTWRFGMKTKAKSLSVIRIAVLENPETKRKVLERVTADGRLSKRAAAKLGVKKVAAWTEVEAKSWAQATKAVRAGKGKKVAP